MTNERELWLSAHLVLSLHGDAAAHFVAGRIAELVLEGDEAGMAVWKAIAVRLDQLMQGARPIQ